MTIIDYTLRNIEPMKGQIREIKRSQFAAPANSRSQFTDFIAAYKIHGSASIR